MKTKQATWQADFMRDVAPIVSRWARRVFGKVAGADTSADDLEQNALCLAMQYYRRLHKQGRAHIASASQIARNAVRHTAAGRRFGSPQRAADALSPAHRAPGESASLDHWSSVEFVREKMAHMPARWIDTLADTRGASPADQVSARIDFSDWLATLIPRDREIAKALAIGERTKDVADHYGLTWGRVSQLRRRFWDEWDIFQAQANSLNS